jgi:hypothetical protein
MVLIKRDIDINLDDHCHNPMELAQLLSSVLFTSGDLSDSLSRTTTGLHFFREDQALGCTKYVVRGQGFEGSNALTTEDCDCDCEACTAGSPQD